MGTISITYLMIIIIKLIDSFVNSIVTIQNYEVEVLKIFNTSIQSELDNIQICGKGNFFAIDDNSYCLPCPDGFECIQSQTLWPNICKEGFYQNNSEDCQPCPKGTFNFEKGSMCSSECIPCPAGTICPHENTNNVEMIEPCQSGYVCDRGTGLISPLACPNGFFCTENTTPTTKYYNPCPAGSICGDGTDVEDSHRLLCEKDYYCPLGSKYYIDENDRLTKCPYGTMTLYQGLKNIFECIPDENFNVLKYISSGEVYSNISNGSSELSNITIDDVEIDQITQNNYYDLIKNINFVDLMLNRISYKNSNPNYNTNRKSLISLSPMKKIFGYQPTNTTTSYYKINKNPIEFGYYLIEENSYALITFDLRHLTMFSDKFLYGVDWDISIEKYYSVTEESSGNIELPEIFLNNTNIKSKVHEFNLYSIEKIYIKISVNFYTGIFVTYCTLFLDTATIQVAKPNRAILDTTHFFAVIIKESSKVNFPINLLFLDYSQKQKYSNIEERIIKNFISYASTDLTIKNKKVEGLNSFSQTGFYWGKSKMIGLPYLPFFSNCKGYGKYIPLWGLLEQNPNCNLVDKENTEFATDLSFGKTIYADTCNIELDCIYDEEIDVTVPYWYNAKQGTLMFSITEEAIEAEDLFENYGGNDLTEVYLTSSTIPENYIPGAVQLNIHYYQKSQIEKRIVAVELKYSDPIKIEDAAAMYIVPYKLKIVYAAYSHTKLMVSFSLSSNFYILLYMIQGVIDLTLVSIFLLYHRCMSRISPTPTFKFFSYFLLMIPQTIYGFLLAMIPIGFVLFIITFTMSGKLFTACDQTSLLNKSCYLSFFDYFPYLGKETIDQNTLRMSRVGTGLLSMGLYLLYRSSKIMIPEEPTYYNSSYDRNSWNVFNWKLYNFLYINFFILSIFVYFIFLSFSSFWGQNFWVFIHIFKLIGICLEVYLKSTLEDQLLIAGIPCLFNIVQGLLTFGASDYVDFLNSAFIELVSLTIERLYFEPIVLFFQDNWLNYYQKTVDFIRKLLKFDIELEEEKRQVELANANNEPILIESGFEMMSENDILNLKRNTPDMFEEANKKKLSRCGKSVEDSMSNQNLLDSIHFEDSTIKTISKNQESNKRGEDESSQVNFNNSRLQNNRKAKKGSEIKVEKLYDKFKVFAADLLSNFYNMTFYLFIWFYYDETQIFSLYSIQQSNFIYFYFFILISPFFYLISDVLFHNMLAYYNGTKMHEFLDYLRYRFRVRKTSWALNDKRINTKLNPEFRKIDKLCFSSQYYFILTIYTSGMCFSLIGIVTVMLNDSNLYGDIATPFIVIYIFILSFTTERFFLWLGIKLKIWHLNVEKEDNDKSLLQASYSEKNILKTRVLNKTVKPPKISTIKNWEILNYLKEQEEIIEENIKTDRMLLEHVRRQFLNENKTWLRDMIGNILSPRTLYLNKEKVIDVIKNRYKIKKSDENEEPGTKVRASENRTILNSKNPFKTEIKSHISSSDSETVIIKKKKSMIHHKHFNNPFDKEKKIRKITEGFNSKYKLGKILKTWVVRAKSSIELFKMVRLAIHYSRNSKCDKCGSNILLRAICVSPILKIFDRYLNETKSSFDNYDPVAFKNYFMENAKILTLCSKCQR